MRLLAVVEVEDDLGDAGSLDLLQGVDDVLRATAQDRLVGQLLRPHVAQDIHDLDEVFVGRRHLLARRRGKGRDQRILEIADQGFLAVALLLRRRGDVHEVGAHGPPHRPLEPGLAGLAIDPHRIGQRPVDHGRRKGSVDHVPVVLRRQLHRGPRKAGHVGPERALRRPRADLDVVEFVEAALVGPLAGLGPGAPHGLQPLGEQLGGLVEGHLERIVLLAVVAAAGGEIDAAARQEIERRPFLGDMQRMVHRQQGHGRRQSQLGRGARQLRQHRQRRGVDAQQVEMMLTDPGRVQSDLLCPQRLGIDVLDEGLGRARIVRIAVVGQREVTELHGVSPDRTWFVATSEQLYAEWLTAIGWAGCSSSLATCRPRRTR